MKKRTLLCSALLAAIAANGLMFSPEVDPAGWTHKLIS
ncbi:Cyclomaltodextrin glucanotransferase [Vibrio cholerae]|nr:Cyclomaltodextrin glucanotransferase [Vibrio cholerae]